MRIFGNFMGPGGNMNTRGKAWEERSADDAVSFNPAGLCCWEDCNAGVAVCKLARTAGVMRTPPRGVTWKTDEWHMPFPDFDSTNWPLQSATTCLPKAPLRSRSSTLHLSHVLQEKVRCFPGRAGAEQCFVISQSCNHCH